MLDRTLRDYSQITVELTEEQLELGRQVGEERYKRAQSKGWKSKLGWTTVGNNILGARCEAAVAVALGLPWDLDLNNFKKRGDVGGLEVRGTNHTPLYIRPGDPPERIYILVHELARGTYRLRGWMRGEEAMARDEWKANPKGWGECWRVLAHHLHPMSDLPMMKENA